MKHVHLNEHKCLKTSKREETIGINKKSIKTLKTEKGIIIYLLELRIVNMT